MTLTATGKTICWIFYMHVNIIIKITYEIPSILDCPFFHSFLDFYFYILVFFFLNTRECSCGLSLDSMSKIAEWLNKRLLTVFICLDSALHTCCQLCLLSFLTIFLFSGITPTKWFCLVLQVKLVWILQNQVNEIWGEGKKEYYTMIALFAFNKWSNELAKYNASS